MILRRVPVAVLVLCLALSTAYAVEIREDIKGTFDVTPGTVLELHHGDGNVTLTAWDQDKIDIRVIYHAEITKVGFGAKPGFDVKFHQSKGRFLAKEEIRGGTTFGFYSRNTNTYTWEIKAPAWISLEIHGDDGDVRISGWQADIDLRIDDGDLTLTNVTAGKVHINLDDGDVEGRNVNAALKIVNDDGDIVFTGLAGPELILATDDGDADIEFAGAAPDLLSAASDDGNLRFSFPGPVSFTYEIRTDDGRIRLDLPGDRKQEIPADGHRLTGTVGGGAGKVKIGTDDGNVELIAKE